VLVGGYDTLIVGECALIGGLFIQRGAHFLSARELRIRGFALGSGVIGCSGRGAGKQAGGQKHKTQRSAGETPVEI